jgi:uncharacterized membrane protein YfcA
LSFSWEWPVGALCAFLISVATTPAGVSGAVLLLPVQVGLLGVPSPAVTPTNLIFNVGATPGGLLRFWREGRLGGPLAALLVAGSLPGVVAGAVIRVEWLADPHDFMFVAPAVLLPLGLWLLLGAQRVPRVRALPSGAICLVALAVGTLGGIYGLGGGSLLAPLLLGAGMSARVVAPATLTATFVTSIAGIGTYQVLQSTHGGAIAPDWALGAWLCAGGFAGSYLGARLQGRMSESALRRLLGAIACAIALRFLQQALEHSRSISTLSTDLIKMTIASGSSEDGADGTHRRSRVLPDPRRAAHTPAAPRPRALAP